jgi:hypothetical protein
MKPLIAVAALLLLVAPALAQSEARSPFVLGSGNDMMNAFSACDRFNSNSDQDWQKDQAICMHLEGYIDGASGTEEMVCTFEGSACQFVVPDGVTHGQMYDVVRKYLVDHPENRQEYPNVLIGMAIEAAWARPKTN